MIASVQIFKYVTLWNHSEKLLWHVPKIILISPHSNITDLLNKFLPHHPEKNHKCTQTKSQYSNIHNLLLKNYSVVPNKVIFQVYPHICLIIVWNSSLNKKKTPLQQSPKLIQNDQFTFPKKKTQTIFFLQILDPYQ